MPAPAARPVRRGDTGEGTLSTMYNLHLFELMNAPPGLAAARLLLPRMLAEWAIYLVPVFVVATWIRSAPASRPELLRMVVATLAALGIAQVVTHVWPQPRPMALHLGTQYLESAPGSGLPSIQVTVFWSLALAALISRRFAPWGFLLMSLGLVVGWSQVFLGVDFPLDVAAALPVALAGTAIARALDRPLHQALARILRLRVRSFARRSRTHENPAD